MTSGTRGSSGSTGTVHWLLMGRRILTCLTVLSWITIMWTSQYSWWTWALNYKWQELSSSPGKGLVKVCLTNPMMSVTIMQPFSDKITAYTDYVYNLDRISVYVSDKPQLDYAGLSTETKCGVITRKNTALFNPRLHFDCPEPVKGRYVYVKATGVPNRWRKLFNLVLCEVMVY